MVDKNKIKKYYDSICKEEKINPLPLEFKPLSKGVAALSYMSKSKAPTKITINLSKVGDIEYAILHEFAHQLALVKHQYPGHGSKFVKIVNYVMDKYMYSKYSEILL